MPAPEMKITVSVRGVMLEKPVRDFKPFIETHLRAEPQMLDDIKDSSFARGLAWGAGIGILLWSVVGATAYWFIR